MIDAAERRLDIIQADAPKVSGARRRLWVSVCGTVQGVGFRPFVYRLATEMGFGGWVSNTMNGVEIEVEGDPGRLSEFLAALSQRRPASAVIEGVTTAWRALTGEATFAVRNSDESGPPRALLLPDLAPCADCLREIADPVNRRFRYPFTTCASCGPRFSIIESLPYDRARTSMRRFVMCAACRREYEDPNDRRFHAESTACPACGPQLMFLDSNGSVRSRAAEALRDAVAAVRHGLIVAVKGVGGFQLIVDARNDCAVQELRVRKARPEKPFALLCASLDAASDLCEVRSIEREWLTSPATPIVLLKARRNVVSRSVAPGNPLLGVMLPASPLHHLLIDDLNAPLVATSGNRADEPICIQDEDALVRLRGIADAWLVHDRPIIRRADDSVVRAMGEDATMIRRGRGYAPFAVATGESARPLVAVGTHLKNTVAVTVGDRIVISPHVGTLSSVEARAAFRGVIDDLTRLYHVQPERVACDLHPDDTAAREAGSWGRPTIAIQHHRAHVLSCMAEHGLDGPVLGVAWDGTGYGLDGTIWGGEFLLVDRTSCHRVGHLRQFGLPGGDRAVKEPRRAALGVLFELFGIRIVERVDLAPIASLVDSERSIIVQMLSRTVNSPRTSSAGRLFDAIASLVDLRHVTTFEGQAATDLEFAIDDTAIGPPYPIGIKESKGLAVVDWEPTIRAILDDLGDGAATAPIARAFHDALVEAIVAVAQRVNEERVVLSGGCFQNRYLTEHVQQRLETEGFRVYRQRRVPPNDGGIALGQAFAARTGG